MLKDSKLNEYLEEKKIMEQKLEDNNNKISKLLIKGLEKQKRNNELKIKENNELKNEIRKLRKSKIELGGLPKLIEDIEKKDNKARTFSPVDKDKERFENLKIRLQIESKEIPEDFDIDEFFWK